ncbi:MAG: PAS domain S-box protein [Myxococcales bacterium]
MASSEQKPQQRTRATAAPVEGESALLKAVLDAAADGILAVDSEWGVQSFNAEFGRIWGLTEYDLKTRESRELLRWVLPKLKDRRGFVKAVEDMFEHPQASWRGVVEFKDGRVFEGHSLPQCRGDDLVGRVWSFRDVTERAAAERALKQSEELFKIAFFGNPDLAGILDLPSGHFIELNDACETVLGWRRDELLGRRAAELPIWPNRAERARVVHLVEEGRDVPDLEMDLLRKDGRLCRAAGSARVLVIGGRPCVALRLRDITERRNLEENLRRLNVELERRVRERTAALEREIGERRRSEESLARSEQRYRELVENANSIILRWDTQGRVRFLNEFGQSFFGYREEDILGRSVVGTIVPDTETSGRDLGALIERITSEPERYAVNENENVRSNGRRVWIAWTNRPVRDASGQFDEVLSVGNDITALKEIEQELVKAKEAAESADRLKSAFLANMSHELRTPLNSIIGFTGLLMQGLAGPLNAEQSKQLGMVQTGARHLLALINDVLDLSKIEAGQLKIEHVPFDLREAVTGVVRAVEPLAAKKGLGLHARLSPDVGTVVSDRRRVEQVLLNLLSNAIKFTDRGEVEVVCEVADGTVETSVRDTGIGIRTEDQALLFRPFQQVEVGLTRKHEGTGLGLSICARLLTLLGGSIRFCSSYGQGSTFTFGLPRAEGAAP